MYLLFNHLFEIIYYLKKYVLLVQFKNPLIKPN